MILSSRPTDRRQLIEEAAGVTKYKATPPRRRAEARRGAAEPDARRRHRVRGREAARHAEAAGGQGAPVSEAARRAAALGKGVVRAQVPPAGGDHRFARGRLTDARERESVAAVAGRPCRNRSRPAAHRDSPRPKTRATGAREAAHARELAINRQQQQIAFDREQVATLDDRTTSIAAEVATMRGAARAGASAARGSPRRLPLRPTPSASARPVGLPRSRRRTKRAIARSRGSSPMSRPRAARSFRRSIPRPRSATRSSTLERRAIASRRRWPSSMSRLTTCASKSDGPQPSGRRTADGLRRAQEAIEATRIARPGARIRAGQRANRARVAVPARCGPRSRRSPASKRG